MKSVYWRRHPLYYKVWQCTEYSYLKVKHFLGSFVRLFMADEREYKLLLIQLNIHTKIALALEVFQGIISFSLASDHSILCEFRYWLGD